jgi:pyruvate-formate lyase
MIARDKAGITALINSVTRIDYTLVPNGSVLDVMLHPSSVQGENGLDILLDILAVYRQKGGFGIHFNIIDVKTLKAAQKNPDQYATLQVRVCGWNAYFVNLSLLEQDEFIRNAEHVKA